MRLDHVNLRCRDPDAMAEFLERLGCARRGERPASDNPGYWLYDDGGGAVVHVSLRAAADALAADTQAGVVDHIAFRTDESAAALAARLAALGISCTRRDNPRAGVVQFVVAGPEGVSLELQGSLEGSATTASA